MRKVKDRRQYDRIPAEGKVGYARSVPQRRQGLKKIQGEGQLKDLSNGGFCLLTQERLSPNQFIKVTVPAQLPGLSIPTLAYVMWTRPVRGKGHYAAGLSFLT